MIHTDRAIVVEGKYDKIKLSSMVDGVIICTGGFRVYKDKEMQAMLRALAKKQGLAVLTDSDTAGFKIRGFLRSICGKENIVDVYIPDLYGKEKRKDHPSKEGKLGVEGVPEEVLQKAFADAGIGAELVLQKKDPITKMDLFELGLSGRAESALRRKQLMKHLTLPEHLTTNALVTVLDALMSREELFLTCGELFEEE
ncbi:toprim domain-containing protein [Negativibacillus massiliensis]|jgi:ribonuclease M5|uniref:toprim domain-containing protein n=1 Tax=Negativibacillus massiliensis TaxID=1871035 RepID=UPI0023F939B9|nr:DUF4093 domain-containing protein [Negativibacillus massiliensis]MDY4047263.1 DUF4093 domain-containing protein [Negativibacillus massiliensis]